NLVVSAPTAAPGDAADETRARGVTSIQAQAPVAPVAAPRSRPAPPPPPPGPPAPTESPAGSPASEATVMRGAVVVPHVTAAPEPEAPSSADGEAPRKRRALPAILVTLGVLVVGGGVAAALHFSDPPRDL